jgi:deoxycytidine triphosphate deaminase
MILSRNAILNEYKAGNIIYHSPAGYAISEFCQNQSVDVHIGDWVYIPDEEMDKPYDKNWFEIKDKLLIKKGTFFLCYTEEFIGTKADSNIHPEWHLRSTIARLGLSHPKAGWGDVGFHNRWCMEFFATNDFVITKHMRIAQIAFKKTTDEVIDYTSQTGNYQSTSNFTDLVKNWNKSNILPKFNNY